MKLKEFYSELANKPACQVHFQLDIGENVLKIGRAKNKSKLLLPITFDDKCSAFRATLLLSAGRVQKERFLDALRCLDPDAGVVARYSRDVSEHLSVQLDSLWLVGGRGANRVLLRSFPYDARTLEALSRNSSASPPMEPIVGGVMLERRLNAMAARIFSEHDLLGWPTKCEFSEWPPREKDSPAKRESLVAAVIGERSAFEREYMGKFPEDV